MNALTRMTGGEHVLEGTIDIGDLGPLWKWLSVGYRALGLAIVIVGLMWFTYGLIGSVAFSDPETSVSWWFSWQLPAVPTVALAVLLPLVLGPSKGFVANAALVFAVVGGLQLGLMFGAGLDGAAAERAFAVFMLGTVVLAASAWLVVSGLRTAYERRTGKSPAPGAIVAISIIVAAVTVIALPRFLPQPMERSVIQDVSRAEQATTSGSVFVDKMGWNVPHHYFLPRLGDRTVALQVGYRVSRRGFPSSRSDWVAYSDDGTVHEAIVWPNRRPLRKVGYPLLTGAVAEAGTGTAGWVAFVVPEATDRLRVAFREDGVDTATWQVDGDGARS